MNYYTEQDFTQKVEYDKERDYWNVVETEQEARKRRDEYAKRMKAQGYIVRKRSNGLQLMSFGGIGSGKAHFTLWLKSYSVVLYY